MIPTLDQDGLIAIHEAKTIQKLASVVFKLIHKNIRCELVIAALRPLEFELPGLCSEPKHQAVLDRYIAKDHKIDIWLKRSPIHPRLTVVRHSDYTPFPILVRSSFHKRVLQAMNSDHGISLVAWRASTWLATFTVLRHARDGDFTDHEMEFLRALHPHVASAVKRIAGRQEKFLTQRSFAHIAEHSTQGIIVLDWRLNQIYSNRAAKAFTKRWSNHATPRETSTLLLPSDMRHALERMLPAVQAAKPNRPFTPRHLDLRVLFNGKEDKLMAKITFLPAKTLTISKGAFLILLTELVSSAPTPMPRLGSLTRRQAECVKHVAIGLSNPAIAKKMGISVHTVRNQLSYALRKLGLKSRYQVAAAVIKSGQAHSAA